MSQKKEPNQKESCWLGIMMRRAFVLAIYLLNLKQVRRIKKCTTESKTGGRDKDGWQAPYAENRGQD